MQHLLNGRKGHHDYGRKQETGNYLATGFGTRGLQPLHGNVEPHLPPQQQSQEEAAGDGITSLKQEQKPAEPAKPENGKKDHSFLITLAVAIAIILILWVIKKF